MSLLAPLKNRTVWLSPTVVLLVLANLIPLGGVLFFDWDIFPVVFLFWLENVIIGGFNVMKMLLAGGAKASLAGKLAIVVFFTIHYGIFTFVHGVFVFVMFGGDFRRGGGSGPFPSFDTVQKVVTEQYLFIAILGLVISHGFSFVKNYLGNGAYRNTNPAALMIQPYGRVVVLHVAIIGGGFLILLVGAPSAALALLILLKIGLDVLMHVKQNNIGSTRNGADNSFLNPS